MDTALADYKFLFQEALSAHPGELWMTPHSFGLKPDAYLEGQLQYAKDSFSLADGQWRKIFDPTDGVITRAQDYVAQWIGSDRPRDIAFDANTHALLFRILSNYWGKKLTIVTTDQEFLSAKRQFDRLREERHVAVIEVPVEPFNTFSNRFARIVHITHPNLVLVSHVFYNSGHVVDLPDLFLGLHNYAGHLVIDDYHGAAAIPATPYPELKNILDHAYCLLGGYKYAMAGPGVCALSLPKDCQDRPVETGWFAGFGDLERPSNGTINYDAAGARYAGATFDPSALYRLVAIWDELKKHGICVEVIHQHVVKLQDYFLEKLGQLPSAPFCQVQLVHGLQEPRAHFLCFQVTNAEAIHHALKQTGVHTDYRGNRLRIGFGLYHNTQDIDELVKRIASLGP